MNLTPREQQIVDVLVDNGGSNKDIATALGISLPTVKTHLMHIFNKLGVNNRLQLVLHMNKPWPRPKPRGKSPPPPQ